MLLYHLLSFLLCLSAEAVMNFTNPLLEPLSTMSFTGTWLLKTATLNHLKNTEGTCLLNFTEINMHEKRHYKARVDFYLNAWDSEPLQSFIIRSSSYNTTSYSVTFNDLGLYLSGGSMKRCTFQGHIDLEDEDGHVNAIAYIASKDCDFTYELQLRNVTPKDFEVSRALYSMFVFTSSFGICIVMFRIQRNCRTSTCYCLSLSIDLLYMIQVMELSQIVWDIYQYFLIPVTHRQTANIYMLQAAAWSLCSFVLFRFNIIEMLYNAQSASMGLQETFSGRNYSKIHTVISLAFGVTMVFVLYRYYLISIFVLHLFYVPQILKNIGRIYYRQTEVLDIAIIGSLRFVFILQIFGTPLNISHEAPRLGYCCTVIMLIIFQMSLITFQTAASIKSDRQERLREYAYFRTKEQELEMPASDCSICIQRLCLGDQTDPTGEEMRTLHTPCGHLFHKFCLLHWMHINPICPNCRHVLPFFDMDYEINVLNHRET